MDTSKGLTYFLPSNIYKICFCFQSFPSFGGQMRVVLFFVCLSFLLLRGDAAMHPGISHDSNGQTYTQLTGKNHQVILADTYRDYAIANDTDPATETEYFISDDVEDEDVNNFSAQKYKLMARSHATHAYPSYPSILNYLCNSFKAPVSFCGPVAHKYILQGVLRI